jgi:hypothetical protein
MGAISRIDRFCYLSTETKPTVNIPAHSELIESDTGNIFKYNGTTWVQIGTGGANHVSDGISGIARNRWCNVAHGTLPVLATSGVVTFTSPGVRGIVVNSVYHVSGAIPLTTTNWRIRYAVDSANDAADAILLPTTEPGHSATVDIGQVGAFNVIPSILVDTEAAGDLRVILITLPNPVVIPVSSPITRLSFAHNLGTSVLIQLGISALEAI